MYAKIYNLVPGDRIVEALFLTSFSKHFALYLGTDTSGVEWIAENHKGTNVQIIPASKYFATVKKIARIDKFTGLASRDAAAV